LAIQAAIELAPTFTDGVVFVPLEAARDPGEVAWAIAGCLATPFAGQRPIADQLGAALADRHHLFVLDNFEQVLPAATLVADLLAHSSRLTILATSRAPLHLSGEHEFSVPPLALPDPRRTLDAATVAGADAVALFLQRAAMVAPAFRLTDQNAPLVAEICLRLDGLPLALELAAARLKFLTPQEVLARLKRRFTLLIGGGRDLPDRQRTLRETVAWSYGLLAAAEQAHLRRLAVFNGGCTLEAATAILAATTGHDADLDAIADSLGALVDQSMLLRDQEGTTEPRLRLLETIREYGFEQLAAHGEEDAAHRAHADYYLALVEASHAHAGGAEHGRWIARLDDEWGNLRAIFDHALLAGDGALALRLGTPLLHLWHLRGYQREGLRLLEAALALDSPIPDDLRARAYNTAGSLAIFLHDYPRAKTLLTESLALYRHLDTPRDLGDLLSSLGWALILQRDFAGAEESFRESLALSRQTGHRSSAAWALNGLAVLARRRSDYTAAHEHLREALALFTAEHDEWGTAFTLDSLGLIALRQGDRQRAVAHYREAFSTYQNLGSTAGQAAALNGLALVVAQGDPTRAARLLGAASSTHDHPGAGVTALPSDEYAAAVAAVRAALGTATFTAAHDAGRARSPPTMPSLRRPPPRPLPAAHPPRPHPRERDILRLVAQGLSDAEVADRLYLSRRTVQSYLTAIYSKLGVNSRTAATRYALDHDLL
ncbi:MAG: tetratricopeptide repeat protein, partial [Thermomicrobiales bacterium]